MKLFLRFSLAVHAQATKRVRVIDGILVETPQQIRAAVEEALRLYPAERVS